MERNEAALLPGIKPVLELLRDSPERIDSVLCRRGLRSPQMLEIQELCRKSRVRYTLLDPPALDRLCREGGAEGPVRHQGVLARLACVPNVPLEVLLEGAASAPLPLVLALDQVKDPGNVGTLARTMFALGAAGLLVPERNSAFLGPAALRSSAGALGRLPVCRATNLAIALDEAEERGFVIYGTGSGGPGPRLNPFREGLELPAVLVLGSEEKGLRPGVAKRCSRWLNIPFRRPFDSLNVAQAGGILLALAAAREELSPSSSAESGKS